MKKATLVLFAGMLSFSTAVLAQEPVLHFETTHHDFGAIKEDNGPVTYRFKYTNTGTSKLILTRVQPACGCTTSNWTKDSIEPGKEGYVDATYDVTHRPGGFNKSITIYSTAGINTATKVYLGKDRTDIYGETHDYFYLFNGDLGQQIIRIKG